jgi:uncharacterized protein YcgI (DUF1989 family)
VNFFSQVVPGDDERASLSYSPGLAVEGDTVTLRTELDLLVVLSTSPHPLSPAPWAPAGARIEIGSAPARGPADASVLFREESARALQLSGRVLA